MTYALDIVPIGGHSRSRTEGGCSSAAPCTVRETQQKDSIQRPAPLSQHSPGRDQNKPTPSEENQDFLFSLC